MNECSAEVRLPQIAKGPHIDPIHFLMGSIYFAKDIDPIVNIPIAKLHHIDDGMNTLHI